MKWIELILVRALDSRQKPTIIRFVDHLMANGPSDQLKAVTMYRDAFVDTDICVYLQWEAQDKSPTRSDVGIKMAAALEEFGRVYHTLWIQDEDSKNR
jgi:hypothetical protein